MNTLYDLISMIFKHSDLSWNEVCNMQITPFYEASIKEVYIGYGDDYGCNQTSSDILDNALECEGLEYFKFVEE